MGHLDRCALLEMLDVVLLLDRCALLEKLILEMMMLLDRCALLEMLILEMLILDLHLRNDGVCWRPHRRSFLKGLMMITSTRA